MIKLFPNYQEIDLTEDKSNKKNKENDNYEWYKGVVFDPDTREFKVISGQFTDKKDFYEKLTKKGYIVRKAYEKPIWDWIQKNAKSTLDGYLMCSTAVSKWRDTNLLDDYYIKLMNDFPHLNREKIKGNPNTRGKDESVITEDEDFDVDLMRPEDDTEGRVIADLKIFGIEDITYNTEEGNIYANILKKSKAVKNYVESSKVDKTDLYCYIWKHPFSKEDLTLNIQKQRVYGKYESLVNQHSDNIEADLLKFVQDKNLTLITPEFIKEVANSSLEQVKADSAAIKGMTNINELSLIGDNHEYISWEEIENKVGSAKTSDTNNNFVTIGIHLKDWDRYLKNTPVDEKDPLHVTKDMPFTCLEKLQEINTNSEFVKFGLTKYNEDKIIGVSSNIIELRYAQSFQFSSKVKAAQSGDLEGNPDLKSVYTHALSKNSDKDFAQKLKMASDAYQNLYKSGAYKWKNNPNFMQDIQKIHDTNALRDTLKTKKNDFVNKNYDIINQNFNTRVGDINTGNSVIKPSSRIHGGDSDGTFINKIDSHLQGQVDAKAKELAAQQEIKQISDEIKSVKARLASIPEDNIDDKHKARLKLSALTRDLKQSISAYNLFKTNSSDLNLSKAEEDKVNRILNAMRNKTPVGIRSMHTYNPDKLVKDFINKANKKQESYKEDFRKKFEAIVGVPDNYNATQMYVNEPSIKQNNCAVVPLMGTIKEEDELPQISMENHDTVNPKLFDVYNDSILEDVQIAMMKIAKDFYDKLEFTPELVDVYFTGSNANYNYNDNSDIDIHLVFDFEEVGINAELLNEYFKLKKRIYNDDHDIKIKGYPVEVGVENVNTPLVSSGVYSLKQNKWVKAPSKDTFDNAKANLGDYEQQVDYIERAINTKDPEQILRLWKEIAKSRRESLANEGETGPNNIIFKKLRAEGYLQRLKDAYYNYASENLSLESLEEIE